MKTVIIIPARYASTRFPGKPLALLGTKTVIQHVAERAGSVSPDVYVATDDRQIFEHVAVFGGRAIMTASEHRSGTDRCMEAYRKISVSTGIKYDVIVNIQGDEPFIHSDQIRQLVGCFEDEKIEIATLAKSISHPDDIFDPNKVKVVFSALRQQTALYFSRAPIPFCRGKEKADWLKTANYYKHLGMYAYRPEVLEKITALPESGFEKTESLEQLRWLENGYTIAVRTTPHESIGIDTPEDLERASEALISGL